MLRNFFNRHPLGSFYTLAVFIVIAVMAVAIPWMASDPSVAATLSGYLAFVEQRNTYGNVVEIFLYMVQVQPAAVMILIFAAAPMLAAMIASMVRGGLPLLKSLFSRFKPWREGVTWKQGIKVYGIFLLIYLAVSAFFLWLNNQAAGPFAFEKVYSTMGGAPLAVLATLMLGLFIDEGGTLEELGWRGYALPLMLDRMKSPLRATLILALMWWAWHLPREIPVLLGPLDLGGYLWNQFLFFVLCYALSVLITFMFNLTGGSVWAGILIHGGTNVWAKGLGGPLYGALGFDLRTVCVLAAAITVIALTRGRLGMSNN